MKIKPMEMKCSV